MRRGVQTVYKKFPTEPSAGLPEWATYIVGRCPRFKVHDGIGPAKTAITREGSGILYRLRPSGQGELKFEAVAVVNSVDQATHSYRKAKPDQLVDRVYVHTIEEAPSFEDAA